jgi:hypothetical protein
MSGAGRLGRRLTVGLGGRFTTSNHPTIATLLESGVDQTVAGEATPSLKFRTNRAVGTDDGYEVTRASTTQRGDQFYKQAGRKRLSTRVELDMGS